jgi:hypothetical protein
MDNTYVKLYRSLLDHDVLAYDNNAFIVFTKLLMKVNRHTGTLTTGRFKLAAMTNLKPSTCRDALQRLVDDSIVTVSTTGYKTDIHICNWGKYQNGDDRVDDNNPSVSRQLDDTITRTKKENKNLDTNVSNNTVLVKTPSLEINELFEYWEQKTGMKIQSNIKKNRFAASNLLKKGGIDAVKLYIDGASFAQQTAYAPKIADFIELQSKLDKLIVWGKGVKDANNRKVVSV